MKLKLLLFCFCCFVLSNNNLFVFARTTEVNTVLESISDIENQKDKYKKNKKTLIKVFEILNKNSLKEADFKESPGNVFLLKVIVPIIVTGVIFYLLNHYYKTIIQSAWPACLELKNLGVFSICKKIKNIFSIDVEEKWESFLSQAFEVFIAITRFYIIGKKPNRILVDVLRITSSSLFLVNKEQFSLKAFKQGAYYTQGWLIYDTFHLVKKLYDDAKPEEVHDVNSVSDKKHVQYKKTRKFLSSYILPFAEAAAALFLSLHITETTDSINARKSMQAIYSMLRILPIYLKSNIEAIDVLLAVHLLIVFLDFGYNFLGGSDGSSMKFKPNSPNKISSDKPGVGQGDSAKKTIEEDIKDKKPESEEVDKNQSDRSSKKYVAFQLNYELLNQLKTKLNFIIKTYPDLELLINDDESLINSEQKQIDSRSLQVILEEKISEIEALMKN